MQFVRRNQTEMRPRIGLAYVNFEPAHPACRQVVNRRSDGPRNGPMMPYRIGKIITAPRPNPNPSARAPAAPPPAKPPRDPATIEHKATSVPLITPKNPYAIPPT